MEIKAEPTSPGKPSSPSKGKGKQRQVDGSEFAMADWVQDTTLLDKLGGDVNMANLGDPVKTIEVSLMSWLARLLILSPPDSPPKNLTFH